MSGLPGPVSNPALWLSDKPVVVLVRGVSMVPFLAEGDRVEVVRAAPSDFTRGDLIVFLRAGEVVVHRVLTREGAGFLEKGDGQPKGNWAPWPEAAGRVVALWKGENRSNLTEGAWPRRMTDLGKKNLRIHRIHSFGDRIPGRYLRRGFIRLFRPLLAVPQER